MSGKNLIIAEKLKKYRNIIRRNNDDLVTSDPILDVQRMILRENLPVMVNSFSKSHRGDP